MLREQIVVCSSGCTPPSAHPIPPRLAVVRPLSCPNAGSGLALVCALIAACIMVSRRNAAANLEVKESTPDFELGGPIDRATPGRFDSQSSGTRGFSGGNPIARKRSFSVGGSVKSLGVGAASPARSMARGDQQRGRSQSRDSTGPRMYSSNTPRRTRGSSTSPGRELGSYDDGGGAMVVVTPGRSHSVRSGGSRTPRRLMSGGDSGRGRQMYDRSSVPSWDESGGRMMGTSRSPGRGLAGGRSDSTGRLRRPSRYTGQGADLGDGKRMTMTPGRRRSNRAGRVGSPHVLGIRRSKSAGHSLSREDDEGNAASVGEEGRWADRGMTAAVGKVERGRRSQRSLSKSARSKSMHDTSDDHKTPRSSGSVDSYGREKRSRSKPNTPSRRSYNRSGTVRDRDLVVVSTLSGFDKPRMFSVCGPGGGWVWFWLFARILVATPGAVVYPCLIGQMGHQAAGRVKQSVILPSIGRHTLAVPETTITIA